MWPASRFLNWVPQARLMSSALIRSQSSGKACRLLLTTEGGPGVNSVPFNVAIGRAVSNEEGVTFLKSGTGPVLSYDADEPFVLSGPKVRRYDGRYYLWYIAGRKWITDNGRAEPVYRIRMASSEDGICWKKEHRDLIEAGSFTKKPRPVLMFSLRTAGITCFSVTGTGRDTVGRERGYRIGYAWSEDKYNWIRDDSRAGIDVSEQGWDFGDDQLPAHL